MDRTLIVVAHEDDETLIAGAYILKKAKDEDIVVVTVIRGRSSQVNTMKKLSRQHKFDYLPLCFDSFRDDNLPSVADEIYKLIDKFKPKTLITHNPQDTHQEHVLVAKAVEIATRPILDLPPLRIMYGYGAGLYENTDHLIYSPNVYMIIDKEMLENKMSMFGEYSSEQKGLRSPDGIYVESRYQGKMVGIEYAECFYLKRDFI